MMKIRKNDNGNVMEFEVKDFVEKNGSKESYKKGG